MFVFHVCSTHMMLPCYVPERERTRRIGREKEKDREREGVREMERERRGKGRGKDRGRDRERVSTGLENLHLPTCPEEIRRQVNTQTTCTHVHVYK